MRGRYDAMNPSVSTSPQRLLNSAKQCLSVPLAESGDKVADPFNELLICQVYPRNLHRPAAGAGDLRSLGQRLLAQGEHKAYQLVAICCTPQGHRLGLFVRPQQRVDVPPEIRIDRDYQPLPQPHQALAQFLAYPQRIVGHTLGDPLLPTISPAHPLQ